MVRWTPLWPMFGAPPAAEIRVYAAAGRLEGGEGAQIHVYAVAARLGRPELSRLGVAIGWRAWSAPARCGWWMAAGRCRGRL